MRVLIRLCSFLFALAPIVQSYAITGVSAGVNMVTGERPLRQEVNSFSGSGPAWDLFILALRQMQQLDQSALLSFFQIAGGQASYMPSSARSDTD